MQGKYQCYKVGREELFSEQFATMLAKERASGKSIYVVTYLTNKFDEWEIEKYVEALKRLAIDSFYIRLSDDTSEKPTYRKIKEVHGALQHFARYVNYYEKSGYQEYHFENMQIFFEYTQE